MKKITLSQLFRYGFTGFLSTIALPSSLLISPALSSTELARATQTQQSSSPELLAPNNLVAQSTPLTAQEIQNRLVGQWQLQNMFFVPLTVVFTTQGKGFVLVPFFGPNANENPIAYEFSYQINNTTQPIQIDIAQPGEAPIKTIFEFTSDGRIRVELSGIKPNEPRPTEFTTGSSLLNRVSNLTALPRNTEIANSLEARARAKEGEGRSLLGSFLRGQQAYFVEKETFTTDVKELGIGIEDFQYDNYALQIISSGNLRQSVFVTATAKVAGVRSFIGAVFVVKEGEEANPIIGVCETIEPSMTPPAPPTLITTQSNNNLMNGSLSASLPKNHETLENAKQIQCAPGSRAPENPRGRRSTGLF
jgi:hypothetical protein